MYYLIVTKHLNTVLTYVMYCMIVSTDDGMFIQIFVECATDRAVLTSAYRVIAACNVAAVRKRE